MRWNIYDAVVVTSAMGVTAIQIILTLRDSQNYALLQLGKVRTSAYTLTQRERETTCGFVRTFVRTTATVATRAGRERRAHAVT
jgi:hypothetical protein